MAVLGLPTARAKPPVWQLAHCVLTDTEAWKRAGVHDEKPLLWQLSQLVIAAPASDWYGMWLALRPSAGGKPPHCAVTGTWLWLKLLGFQEPPVRWQASQLWLPTGTWVADLPVAREPL